MATSLYDWFGKRSYAQSGEDIIAWGELKNSKNQKIKKAKGERGFYVDVGAYHPKLLSNTYLFYKKGWRGICVDPNPEMASLFRVARPRDVFLNVGVGGDKELKNSRNQELKTKESKKARGQANEGDGSRVKPGMTDGVGGEVMEYWMFEDGAANTFSAVQAKKNQEEAGRKLIGTRRIPIWTLKKILDRYVPKGQKIDLLSVDVEGMDEEALRSNDWKKYRPTMIIAEDLRFDLEKWVDGKMPAGPGLADWGPLRPGPRGGLGVVWFLMEKGYKLVAKTPYSLIFKAK